MTQERINQIKHYTVDIAYKDLKKVDYSDSINAAFEVGKIFGKLERNLDRELFKEFTREDKEKERNELNFIVKNSSRGKDNV